MKVDMLLNFQRGILKNDKRSLYVIIAFVVGVLTAFTFLVFMGLPDKYLYGMLIAVIFVAFAFTGDIEKRLLGLFLILAVISLDIDVWNIFGVDSTVRHRGGEQPIIKLWISQLPFMVMFALWILSAVSRKRKISFTPIDIPAVLFLMLSAFSIFVTTRLDLSVVHLLRMVFFYVVYLYFANNINDIKTIRFVIKVLLIGLLLQSLLSYAQYWLHIPFSIGDGGFIGEGYEQLYLERAFVNRVQGTIGFPNTLGLYIALMLQVTLAAWLTGESDMKWMAPSAFIFGLIAMIMTYSRGAWTGFAVAAFIVFIMLYGRGLIRMRGGPIIVIGVLLSVFLLSIFGYAVYLRLTTSKIGATLDRIKLMQVAWEMIKAHPFMGVGLNTFTEVMKYYDRTGVSSYFPHPVHNYFLLVAAETGIGSLVAFLVVIAISMKMVIDCARESFFRILSVLSIGAAGAIVVILVGNLVDYTIRTYPIGLFLWIMLGLIGACYNIDKKYKDRISHGS